MTTIDATYSFLPWLRQGVANQIMSADQDATVKLRATFPVKLTLAGEGGKGGPSNETVERTVQLFGPGDVVGIDSRAIIRTEPRNWITNYEPNFIPAIEFYDEDFPWRYTPAAPDLAAGRLRPWIALVVLKAGEYENGTNLKDRPLPFIKVRNRTVFPPANQLWAWAHVHVNRSLHNDVSSTDMATVLGNLQITLNEDRDLAYSRIICPRKLAANAAYDAFLLPVFESGRLAGLGLPPGQAQAPHATFSAWAPYPDDPDDPNRPPRPEPEHYPVYYRWHFRTGTAGDFEYLVRLLKPRPIDKRVGTRDMDVQKPGVNLPGIDSAALGGVLKLGGALRVPPPESKDPKDISDAADHDRWAQPYPHPFQKALASFINLGDDYTQLGAGDANAQSHFDPAVVNDPDPMITPPLYGRWHALTQRLLEDRNHTPLAAPANDNWVHELNLDPRFRVAAGFGTRVVQANQEDYMNAAWEQVGDVLEANRRIRAAQLAKEIAGVWYERHLRPLSAANAEKAYTMVAPLQKRVLVNGTTVFHQMNGSRITPALVSMPMRRITRPRGRVMKRLRLTGRTQVQPLLARIDGGGISAAPPKRTPKGAVTVTNVTQALLLGTVSGQMRKLLQTYPDGNLPSTLVRDLPKRPNFAVLRPVGTVRGAANTPAGGNISTGNSSQNINQDSREAVRFKTALQEVNDLIAASEAAAVTAPRSELKLNEVTATLMANINPDITIPRRTMQSIRLPTHLRDQFEEGFVEAMAYPEIDVPMYKPLVNISAELFLPNINLIEQNSTTLLETNQKFIEAYMVGLNHEFARELLWREYPTDQRGSYFRQFWAVDSYLNTKKLAADALKETLRDIPMLHRWLHASKLGRHDNREAVRKNEEELVLVIRGELLKKYPNTVIYANLAEWAPDGKNGIDNTKERKPVELRGAELDNPPPDKIKMPLYEAQVAPDIYFLGFDLTAEVAKGGTGEKPDDTAGWFFVIKERPGEPRFGLDIDRSGDLNVWNDLSWNDVLPKGAPGDYIQITSAEPHLTPVNLQKNPDLQEKDAQYQRDTHVLWNANSSAADIAYILYQAPVLMAVHAAEM